jgi:putative ABC transport system substrate-binding protein
VAFSTALALVSCGGSNKPVARSDAKPLRIGLVYIGPHELINQIVSGFKDGIAKEMSGHPYEIVERHANGDKSQVSSTINAAISSGLDVLVTLTTPPSQQALKSAPANLPVVFIAVTDPVGAGLVKSLESPQLSTGVSDLAPLENMLKLIARFSPRVKKIGLPYSPEEEPAVFSRNVMLRVAPQIGFSIDARPVTSKDELPSLLRDLVRSNDAIVVGADNGMFEASPMIAKTCLDADKPFFSADSSSVKAGAVAALTIDYVKVGRAGASVVARVLGGEKAGSIPVTLMTEGVLEVNQTSLRKLGLTVPEDLQKQVTLSFK